MVNVPNEILDPAPLEVLFWTATGVDQDVSLATANGGVPVLAPVVLNLRMYDGTVSGATGWDTEFDWPSTYVGTYVGLPEQFRQYYQDFRTRLAAVPVGHGLTWETRTDEQVQSSNPNPAWNLIFDEWRRDFMEIVANGDRPPIPLQPAPEIWHGFWPSGYEYRTLPELQSAFDAMDFALEKAAGGAGGDFTHHSSHLYQLTASKPSPLEERYYGNFSMSDTKELRFSLTVTNPGASPMAVSFGCRAMMSKQTTRLTAFNSVHRLVQISATMAVAGTTREDPVDSDWLGDEYESWNKSSLGEDLDLEVGRSVIVPGYGSVFLSFRLSAVSTASTALIATIEEAAGAEDFMDHTTIGMEITAGPVSLTR